MKPEAAGSDQPLQQIPMTIQGQVSDVEPAKFTGQVVLAASNPLEFTAIRVPLATESHSSH